MKALCIDGRVNLNLILGVIKCRSFGDSCRPGYPHVVGYFENNNVTPRLIIAGSSLATPGKFSLMNVYDSRRYKLTSCTSGLGV